MLLNVRHYRSFTEIARDLRWGFGQAFYITALFGGVGIICRLVIGDSYIPGVGLIQLVLAYALLGFAAGVLIGILRPLTRGLVGSAVVGGLWGICLELVIRLPFGRWGTWVPFDAIFMAITTISGGFFGIQIRRVSTRIEAKRRAGVL